MTTTPMNFRVPAELKIDFERTCRSLNIAMTAQLIFMMRAFIEAENARQRDRASENEPLPFFSNFT